MDIDLAQAKMSANDSGDRRVACRILETKIKHHRECFGS